MEENKDYNPDRLGRISLPSSFGNLSREHEDLESKIVRLLELLQQLHVGESAAIGTTELDLYCENNPSCFVVGVRIHETKIADRFVITKFTLPVETASVWLRDTLVAFLEEQGYTMEEKSDR
jgi:hypothetical protein